MTETCLSGQTWISKRVATISSSSTGPDTPSQSASRCKRERHEGDEVYYFAGPDQFYLGLPDYLIGSDFEIEPI